MGAANTEVPVSMDFNSLPLRRSNTRKVPSMLPWNSSPLAVVNPPPRSCQPRMGADHRVRPVSGSMARSSDTKGLRLISAKAGSALTADWIGGGRRGQGGKCGFDVRRKNQRRVIVEHSRGVRLLTGRGEYQIRHVQHRRVVQP